jgi:hypothetical protein
MMNSFEEWKLAALVPEGIKMIPLLPDMKRTLPLPNNFHGYAAAGNWVRAKPKVARGSFLSVPPSSHLASGTSEPKAA